jgi:hypothetical protein
MLTKVTATSYALAVGLPGVGSKLTTPLPEQGTVNDVGNEAANPYVVNFASEAVTAAADRLATMALTLDPVNPRFVAVEPGWFT